MSTQNENLFVKLVKKSVGLPTGKSECCGAPAGVQSNNCCNTEASQAPSGCGCSNGGGDCCSVQDEIESDSLKTIGGTAM